MLLGSEVALSPKSLNPKPNGSYGVRYIDTGWSHRSGLAQGGGGLSFQKKI